MTQDIQDSSLQFASHVLEILSEPLSAAIVPDGVEVSDTALRLDFPVMIAVAVACLPIFFTGHLIARWEGGLFFGYYIAYTAYLVLAATIPSVSRTFGFVMLGFVGPLTVVTLVVGVVRAVRRKESSASDRNDSTADPS